MILATGLMSVFNGIFGKDAFIAWGFRIPFLLSLVLVAIGLYLRLRIMETPQFAKVVSEQTTTTAPLLQVIPRSPKEIILSALLRMSEQMPFYIVTAFVLSYMTTGSNGHDYTYNFVLIGTLIAAAVEFVLVPLFGLYSDTIGRKKIYAWGAAILGVWGFIYFALLDSGVTWLAFVALCLGLVPHAMQYGPQASIIAESFPTNLRYTGAGLGYQLSSIIAGGPAALIATWLIHEFGTGYAVSVYILISAVITLVALKFLKDRSRSDITDESTYA